MNVVSHCWENWIGGHGPRSVIVVEIAHILIVIHCWTMAIHTVSHFWEKRTCWRVIVIEVAYYLVEIVRLVRLIVVFAD